MKSQRLNQPVRHDKKLATEWFVGLDDEQKDEYAKYVFNSTRLTDHLKKMIQRRYDASVASKVTDYDSANWAYQQAHKNGYQQALEEIFNLLP